MQRLLLLISFLVIQFIYLPTNSTNLPTNISAESECRQLFTDMKLDGIVNYDVFAKALCGYQQITNRKKEIITLIDFSKASSQERLYVLDVKQRKLLFSSYVSHGRNSGGNYATSFSNKSGSYQSSLGFYVTENTYIGKNGYSLVLNGLEKGFNDKAKERAIVVHGAAYSSPCSIASNGGRLGRSLGCPALPEEVSKSIINTIKDGSVMFIYANNQDYLSNSCFLAQQ